MGIDENSGLSLTELIDKHFDLTAYEPLNEMEPKDWGIQFFIRNRILVELKESTTPSKDLQKSIFKLLKNPILSYDNYPFTLHLYNSPINDLTVSEAYNISKKYSTNGAFNIFEESPENEDSLDHSQQDLQSIFDLCVSSAGNDLATDNKPIVTATIDLSATDTQLIKDFGEYLTAKRKELGTDLAKPKKFKVGKFTPLVKHKVIQYIDLKILDRYVSGNDTLTQHEIGERLFPDTDIQHKDATEAVRKSTIKYANEMLDDRVIKSLLISSGN